MEENNKIETNVDSSGSGSMLYGAGPQPPQAEESGHSSVYGAQPQGTAPVQLTKAAESEPDLQGMTPVRLTKPAEAASNPQGTVPVPLAKPAEAASNPQGTVPPIPQQSSIVSPQPPVPQSWQPSPMPQGQPGNGQPGYYGQPVNGGQPGQNQMGFGPMQVPPPVQGAPAGKPKKNAAGLVVGILCAAAVVIVIVIGALAAKALLGGNSPEKQLAKGIANMTKEMAAYQGSVAGDLGLDALYELADTKPIHTNMNFSFTDPSSTGSISSVNMKLDSLTDYSKKMAEYGLDVGVYGFNMNVGKIVASDNTLYVSVPLAFQDEVYSLELTNLGRDFNNSAWSSFLEEKLPEDYSLTLFGDRTRKLDEDNSLFGIFQKQGGVDADSMKVEMIGQTKEFTFDGMTAEYGGVRVTIDKDAYNKAVKTMRDDVFASDVYDEYMKSYQVVYGDDYDWFKQEVDRVINQMFDIRFEQDVVLDFYLDEQGRIVNMSTPEDIAVSGQDSDIESFAVDISFAGTERTLDSIDGGIYVKVGDEILYMGISRTASITEEYYKENLTLCMQENNSDDEFTFWYANEWGYDDKSFDLQMSLDGPDWSLGVSADGVFSGIVEGESFTLHIDHGAVTMDGEDMLLMTGFVGVELGENEIEVPDHAINVFEMSESDIEDLFYGVSY